MERRPKGGAFGTKGCRDSLDASDEDDEFRECCNKPRPTLRIGVSPHVCDAVAWLVLLHGLGEIPLPPTPFTLEDASDGDGEDDAAPRRRSSACRLTAALRSGL
jgi:hypothetical protein